MAEKHDDLWYIEEISKNARTVYGQLWEQRTRIAENDGVVSDQIAFDVLVQNQELAQLTQILCHTLARILKNNPDIKLLDDGVSPRE
jgi:hypothetical protein